MAPDRRSGDARGHCSTTRRSSPTRAITRRCSRTTGSSTPGTSPLGVDPAGRRPRRRAAARPLRRAPGVRDRAGVATAYLHDIGMVDMTRSGRRVHAIRAAQAAFGPDVDGLVGHLLDGGPIRERLDEVDADVTVRRPARARRPRAAEPERHPRQVARARPRSWTTATSSGGCSSGWRSPTSTPLRAGERLPAAGDRCAGPVRGQHGPLCRRRATPTRGCGRGRAPGRARGRRHRRDARAAGGRRAPPARHRAPDVRRVRGLHGRRHGARGVHAAARERRRGLRDHLRRPARRRRGQHPRGASSRARGHLRIAFHRGVFGSPEARGARGRQHRRTSSSTSRPTSSPRSAARSIGGGLTPPSHAPGSDPDPSWNGPTTGPRSRTRSPPRLSALHRRSTPRHRGRRRHAVRGRARARALPRRDADRWRRVRGRGRPAAAAGRSGAPTVDGHRPGGGVLRRWAGSRVRPGEVLVARGSRAGVRLRPDGRRAGRPPDRRLRTVAAAGMGPGRDDGRHPQGGAQQRHRRRRGRGRRGHPGRGLRPRVAPAARRRASSSRGCGRRSAHDAVHDRAGRRAPPGRRSSRTSRDARSRRSRSGRARSRWRPARRSSRKGAVEDHLYAIVHGSLRVHRGDETLAILGPGATVGELAALVPEPQGRLRDGARAIGAAADRQAAARRAARGSAGARERDHRRARRDGPRAWPAARGAGREQRTDRPDRHVTPAPPPPSAPRAAAGAVPWLTAQALLFGAWPRCSGVVANAMFLDAYGAGWLPATYIAIGIAGIVVSGTVARTAQRFDLVGLAVTVLGGAAAGIGIAWVAGPRRVRALGLDPAPRPVPDPHPARLRVHRRAGGPDPRHRRASRRASRGS